MSSRFPANLLAQLEARRYRFDPVEAAHTLKILTSLGAARFADARSLIRFHSRLGSALWSQAGQTASQAQFAKTIL